MFNQEIKTAFLDAATKSQGSRLAYANVFNFCEPYEEKWNADLCTRSTEELQSMLEQIAGARASYRKTYYHRLVTYVKWCIAHGVDGACDSILRVDPTISSNIGMQTVRSPAHLQSCLDQVFDPVSERTIDCVYRALFWMAYSGLHEKDTVQIMSKHLDFRSMEIHFGDKVYPIYRESIPVLRVCATSKTFLYETPRYSITRDRVEGDLILRGFRTQPDVMKNRIMYARKIREAAAQGRNQLQLTYARVHLSGIFYRMLEREISGVKPDFSAVVLEELEYSGHSGSNAAGYTNGMLNERKKHYQIDYNNWKRSLQL